MRKFVGTVMCGAALLVLSTVLTPLEPAHAAAAPTGYFDSDWWYCNAYGGDHQTLYVSGIFQGSDSDSDGTYRNGFSSYLQKQYNESPSGSTCFLGHT